MLDDLFKRIEKEVELCIKLKRKTSRRLQVLNNELDSKFRPSPFDERMFYAVLEDKIVTTKHTEEEKENYEKYTAIIKALFFGSLFKKEKVICSRSGEETDDFVVVDGKFVSRTMLTDNDFYCDYCHEYHNMINTPSFDTVGGGKICERVCKQYFKRCKMCGVYDRTDNIHFLSYSDHDCLCHDCYRKIEKYRIKGYHNTPLLVGYEYDKETGKNEQRTMENFKGYGIELEIDNGGEDNITSKDIIQLLDEEVYTMHDGSINNGFEIITHPHTEEALYNMNWADTFKWLLKKGYRSHDVNTCGLHMHISRKLFKDNDAICKMMYFYEKFRNDIVKISRRTSDKVDRWAGFYLSPTTVNKAKLESIFDAYNFAGHSSRYKCVNLTNRNTIEIRIMKGTLKIETFLATLDFIITVAKNANEISWEDINNQELWLKGLKDSTVDYLIIRKAFKGDTSQRTIDLTQSEQSIIINDDEIETIKYRLEEINKQCV